jgi:hypothetical protein
MKVPQLLRYRRLAGALQDYRSVPVENLEPIEIIYMYYDTTADGDLSIAMHEDFDPLARDLIGETLNDY